MPYSNSRRTFIRDLGLSAAAIPFLTNLPSLAAPMKSAKRKQRLVVLFSPDGIVPSTFWPDPSATGLVLKEAWRPWSRSRTVS
jgi:hypothetical protein